ncbi:MAG: hypothetical protein J6Z43_05515 [Clostridiales bacterium]|nr:hypothetical protein [Clostridiales bacterium]
MKNYDKLSMRHHEFKIAYLNYQISKVANGFFKCAGGRSYVYVFYDPSNSKVNRDCKIRYSIETDRGKYYAAQVTRYQELKCELDILMKAWKRKYSVPPRAIQYPLNKTRTTIFDHDWFIQSPSHQNKKPIENPINYNGIILRSKNELIQYKTIEALGYEQKVEMLAVFKGNRYFYPDSTFYVPEIDKVILSNLDGSMENPNYVSKSYYDTAICINNGLIESKDFVVARISNYKQIDAEQIENLILSAIDASINDIIIE